MVCLDSDILINFLRKDRKTINLINELLIQGRILSTTSINFFELLKGIPNSSKINKKTILEFLSNFKTYNFEIEASKKAAEIFNDLKSKGEIIELADILIASVVIASNETIITNNSNHFERIKELKIEDFN